MRTGTEMAKRPRGRPRSFTTSEVLERVRVVFMEKGRIAEAGPPAEIFNNPRSPRLIEFLRSSRD